MDSNAHAMKWYSPCCATKKIYHTIWEYKNMSRQGGQERLRAGAVEDDDEEEIEYGFYPSNIEILALFYQPK